MISRRRDSKSPEEVFTPRSAIVNDEMYVSRGDLENRLTDALRSNKYIIIHGDSGNGKTWLFKKVLLGEGYNFTTLNLSNAKLYGSLSAAIEDKLGSLGFSEEASQESTVTGGFGVSATKAEKKNTYKVIAQTKGAFTKLIEHLRKTSGSNPAALVLDNFEQIMDDEELLAQLRALVISADDDEIAQHNVKVLIVGVPGNLKDLIAKTSGANPIINRLTEIPEVGRIDDEDAKALVKKGLFSELKYGTNEYDEDQIAHVVSFFSDGIAQQIHDFGLHIAQEAERNDKLVNQAVLDRATRNWVTSTLSADWAIIEEAMNSRKTEVGRKNQTLYCIARAKQREFKTSDIEKMVKATFKTGNTTLNISQVLSGFSGAKNPILERTAKDDAWRFISPKLKIVLRLALVLDSVGRVGKADYMEKLQ